MNVRNEVEIPDDLLCPLSRKILIDAVILPDKKVVDHAFIIEWINKMPTNPFTNTPLAISDLKPHVTTIHRAKEFLKKHKSSDNYVTKEKELVDISYLDKTLFIDATTKSDGKDWLKYITWI